MLVPYDRRQPYCSGLAVRPSIVAAESKALITVIERLHLRHKITLQQLPCGKRALPVWLKHLNARYLRDVAS